MRVWLRYQGPLFKQGDRGVSNHIINLLNSIVRFYPSLSWWEVGTLGQPVSVSRILFELRILLFGLTLLVSVVIG